VGRVTIPRRSGARLAAAEGTAAPGRSSVRRDDTRKWRCTC